jgi:hypothetical protein
MGKCLYNQTMRNVSLSEDSGENEKNMVNQSFFHSMMAIWGCTVYPIFRYFQAHPYDA